MAKKRKNIAHTYYMYRGLNHNRKEIFYGVSKVGASHFYRYGLSNLSTWNGVKHKLEWKILSTHSSEAEAWQAATQESQKFAIPGYISCAESARRKSLKRRFSKFINDHYIDEMGERTPVEYAEWCIGIAATKTHESLVVRGLGVTRLTIFKILDATFYATAKYMVSYYCGNGLSESEHQSAEAARPAFVYIYKKPYKIRQAELAAERQAKREKENAAKNSAENAAKNSAENLENPTENL